MSTQSYQQHQVACYWPKNRFSCGVKFAHIKVNTMVNVITNNCCFGISVQQSMGQNTIDMTWHKCTLKFIGRGHFWLRHVTNLMRTITDETVQADTLKASSGALRRLYTFIPTSPSSRNALQLLSNFFLLLKELLSPYGLM